MKILKHDEIANVLEKNGRVYLCGNLQRPTAIQHIPTDGYEIGISDYPVYTFEKAHIHTFNKEYNYVLEGAIKILLLKTGQEYTFTKGDLFMIDTDEPYTGKELPGTRTIFSKVPGGNDKVLVEMDERVLRWGESWESTYN